MIALDERDADRIASHLRKEIEEIDDAVVNAEKTRKHIVDLGLLGVGDEAERKTAAFSGTYLENMKTRKAEIANCWCS